MRLSLIRKSAERLTFDGQLIAEASSDEAGKDRWTVHRIYRRLDADGWVLETVGHSRVTGETMRADARYCVLAEDLVEALMKSDSSSGARHFYLTSVALAALEDAITADSDLWEAIGSTIEDLV